MNTYQISASLLNSYAKEKLTKERITFLITQVNKQLEEISQNQALYESFLNKVHAPKDIDNIILWILFMSNEIICWDYIDEFNKDFKDIIPVSDLADLLLYAVYLKKVKNDVLEGFEYLLEYKEDGMEEVDQFAFTNTFLFVQKSKEVPMEF